MLAQSEEAEQCLLCRWLDTAHPGALYYAVPNGGLRDKVTAAKLKATGVKAGVPDLVIAEPRGGRPGLYVEMKRRMGGRLSASQRDWIAKLRARGYQAEACAGAEAAMEVIDRYLRGEPWMIQT
jgi:hypothetical protein